VCGAPRWDVAILVAGAEVAVTVDTRPIRRGVRCASLMFAPVVEDKKLVHNPKKQMGTVPVPPFHNIHVETVGMDNYDK
jgi:hypothetical protein